MKTYDPSKPLPPGKHYILVFVETVYSEDYGQSISQEVAVLKVCANKEEWEREYLSAISSGKTVTPMIANVPEVQKTVRLVIK